MIRRISSLLKLRPPKWDAVKRNAKKHINTRSGVIWSVITGVTALAMGYALFMPYSPVVEFFGGYALGCFFPMLVVLLIRRWNRTLAFPAAMIFSAVALLALIDNFYFDNALITLFVIMTLLIGAASDRLSFIYKWKPPFNYIGLVVASAVIFFAVYFAFMFLAVAVLLFIVGIFLLLMLIRAFFGFGRRGRFHHHRRWW